MENIQRDLFKERGEERKKQEQRCEQQVSEDSQGDRAENLHTDLSNASGRGRKEKKSKSRDLSNGSLETDRELDSREPTWMSLERERGEERKRLRAKI